jgi:hypothetical protein
MAFRDTEIDKLLIAGRIGYGIEALAANGAAPNRERTSDVSDPGGPAGEAKLAPTRHFALRRRRSQNA